MCEWYDLGYLWEEFCENAHREYLLLRNSYRRYNA